MQNSTKKLKKSEIQLFNREKVLAIFDEKIEIRERCGGPQEKKKKEENRGGKRSWSNTVL